ncbi:MAG: winged helix-turn-helix transcriptional regulator [Flavobacteriia bacterium]|nr:winged helix-turn-helix transcriptional regulator [Flavobacteriia bacterium]
MKTKYSKKQIEEANKINALAHPARLSIVFFLLQHKQCVCNQIVNELPLAQSTVSQHLKVLKESGWLKGEIKGKNICYCLDKKNFLFLEKFAKELLFSFEEIKNCAC